MSHFKASQWFVTLGAVLVSTGALAADTLNCPAGTKQTERVDEGIRSVLCLKAGVSDYLQARHGPVVRYSANGTKLAEGQFADGLRTGTWTVYDSKGVKLETVEVQQGHVHGQRIEFFPTGQKKLVEHYANGAREGLVQEFSRMGQVVRTAQYKAGHPVAQ